MGGEGVIRHLVIRAILLRNDHDGARLDHRQVFPHPSASHHQKRSPLRSRQGPADPAEEANDSSEDYQTSPVLLNQLILTKLTTLLHHCSDGVARPDQTHFPRRNPRIPLINNGYEFAYILMHYHHSGLSAGTFWSSDQA